MSEMVNNQMVFDEASILCLQLRPMQTQNLKIKCTNGNFKLNSLAKAVMNLILLGASSAKYEIL
jgi:hypothetical protein